MMEDLENVLHEAADRASRLMNMSNQADLALIEPDAMAFRTHVDFDVLEISLRQVTAALRTLHEVLATPYVAALLIEQRPHLLDQLCVLACKILVFVPGRVFFRMAVHGAFSSCSCDAPYSSCGGLLAPESGRVESGLAIEWCCGLTGMCNAPLIVSCDVVSALAVGGFFAAWCVTRFGAGFAVESAFLVVSGLVSASGFFGSSTLGAPAWMTSAEEASRAPGRVRAATSAGIARGELLLPVYERSAERNIASTTESF